MPRPVDRRRTASTPSTRRTHDNAGNWGPVFTDTINLQAGGPPPPPPSTYAELVANDGPMSYWRLNELSGTNAADSAGSNPGIYTGGPTLGAASLLTNDGGKAVTFSGSNQSVGVASSASLALASTVSLEAWIKPTSLPAAGTFASVLTKPESYSLQFNGPDMEFTIMQAGARSRLLAPAGAIVAGSVYHVVGTYDGTTQRLYINGTQVASAPLTGAITTNTNALNIASWDGASEFLAGTVDEAAVYAAVLSPTQIANHYSTGTTGNVPPTQSQLTVSRSGTGTGTVTSAPAGINCGATCAASFNNGSSVTLTAAPASGSVFSGWSGGGCSGTGTCTLTLNANTTVTAAFDPAPSTLDGHTQRCRQRQRGLGAGGHQLWCHLRGIVRRGNQYHAHGRARRGFGVLGLVGWGLQRYRYVHAHTRREYRRHGDVRSGTGEVDRSPCRHRNRQGHLGTVGYRMRRDVRIVVRARHERHAHGRARVRLGVLGLVGRRLQRHRHVHRCAQREARPSPQRSTQPPSAYFQAVKADDPVGYWRLDERSGTTAADSARTNTGTYQGAVTHWVAGLLPADVDRATAFSGSNQFVRIPSTTALSRSTTVSVEAWIKPVSIPAVGAFASVLTKPESYSLQLAGPKMEFTIMQAGTRHRLRAATAIVAGSVYHVVGTYNGTTQRLYINGTQVASAALTGAITTNTNALNIASWNGTSEFFGGTIDEAAVYAAVLSATKIANHYSKGTTVTTAMRSTVSAPAAITLAGSSPVATGVDDALGRIYVTRNHGEGLSASNGVTVIDAATHGIVAEVTTGRWGPSALAVDPVRHLVYVTSATWGSTNDHSVVVVIDGRTNRIVRRIPVGPGPKSIAVNAKTNRVYVTDQNGMDAGQALAVIDGATGRTVAVIPMGRYARYYENPLGLAVDTRSNTVYATNPLEGTLYVVDGATNTVKRSLALGDEPTAVAVDTATGRAFVAHAGRGSTKVSVIDGHAGAVVKSIRVAGSPRGIAVDPQGGTAYVTTAGHGTAAIDTATAQVAELLDCGPGAYGVTVSTTGTVIVADRTDEIVCVLPRRTRPPIA